MTHCVRSQAVVQPRKAVSMKRTYSTPKLESYGPLAKFTQGSGGDGGGGGPILDIMIMIMLPL